MGRLLPVHHQFFFMSVPFHDYRALPNLFDRYALERVAHPIDASVKNNLGMTATEENCAQL
jgi:hypothetical protein